MSRRSLPATSLSLLLAVACHSPPPAAPATGNQGGATAVTRGNRCGVDKAADLFGDTVRGVSGTCRRDGDALVDDQGEVASIAACGITVIAPGLPDDVGVQVGDDLRSVLARFPAGSEVGCRPDGGHATCGVLDPGDDRGDPVVQYHLAATLAIPIADARALAELGGARVASYFEQDGCD